MPEGPQRPVAEQESIREAFRRVGGSIAVKDEPVTPPSRRVRAMPRNDGARVRYARAARHA